MFTRKDLSRTSCDFVELHAWPPAAIALWAASSRHTISPLTTVCPGGDIRVVAPRSVDGRPPSGIHLHSSQRQHEHAECEQASYPTTERRKHRLSICATRAFRTSIAKATWSGLLAIQATALSTSSESSAPRWGPMPWRKHTSDATFGQPLLCAAYHPGACRMPRRSALQRLVGRSFAR